MQRTIGVIGGIIAIAGAFLGFFVPGMVLWYSVTEVGIPLIVLIMQILLVIAGGTAITACFLKLERVFKMSAWFSVLSLIIVSFILPYTFPTTFQPFTFFGSSYTYYQVSPLGQPIPFGIVDQFWGGGFWLVLAGSILTIVAIVVKGPKSSAGTSAIPEGQCIVDADLSVVRDSPECDDEEILKEQGALLQENNSSDDPDKITDKSGREIPKKA